MINIDTTTLPENIQTAYQNFEHHKSHYAQLQDRLEQLHQRLEKHRKSAEATKIQADQLDAQWREEFRNNDGELTKEIRAMKNSAQESIDFCEEYSNLANTLQPEFELCQLDTVLARKKYLEWLTTLKSLYADYNFTKAAEELFSLPQAIPFLESLQYKYKEIDTEMKTCELYVRIPDDDTVAEIQLGKEGKLIKFAVEKFSGKSAQNKPNENTVLGLQEINRKKVELTEINMVALGRKREELQQKMRRAQ
jgi:hypothetical protein